MIQSNVIPEGIIRRNIYMLSSAVVYSIGNLPSLSLIFTIVYHLEPTPESYKLIKTYS